MNNIHRGDVTLLHALKRAKLQFARHTFVNTWKFRPNRKICPAFEQQLCYRETPIPILRCGVENWSLPTDTRPIHRRTRIYIGSTIKKKLGRFRISELGSNMQQRRSLQEQATSCCTAAVKFLKSPMHEIRRRVQLFGHSVSRPRSRSRKHGTLYSWCPQLRGEVQGTRASPASVCMFRSV